MIGEGALRLACRGTTAPSIERWELVWDVEGAPRQVIAKIEFPPGIPPGMAFASLIRVVAAKGTFGP